MLVSSRVGLAPHHASVGKLPSSLYKGVVPQTNGRGGAQIYEKHQRVWLGTFNREEDAFRAYDRAALKFRGREAIINFCPARGGDLEDRFMSVYNKEAIVDMLRKHTYDEELEYHRKRIMMTTARSVAMKNAEASGSEGSGRRAIVYQENQAASDGNRNAVTSGAAMVGLPREYLFDKAVTPSDVGKLYLMLQQSGNPHSEAARVHLGPRKNPTCLYRSLVVAEVEMLFLGCGGLCLTRLLLCSHVANQFRTFFD